MLIRGVISPKRFLAIGFLTIFILLAFYIYQVQAYTQAGFSIANHEKQIEEMATAQKQLMMNLFQANSFADPQAFLQSNNYQEIGKVRYIQITSAQVAVK